MKNVDDYLKEIDSSDENIIKAKSKLERISLDPKYRRSIVEKIEKEMEEIQNQNWENSEEEFTVTIKGLYLMRLHVVLLFFSEILGFPKEDVLSYLLKPGIDQETFKLGLVRQAVMETLGYSVPDIQDLSVDAEDLTKE